MSDKSKHPTDALKLSRATLRKINKVATGPLLGPVEGFMPPVVKSAEPTARVAPIGAMLSVRARIERALDGDTTS